MPPIVPSSMLQNTQYSPFEPGRPPDFKLLSLCSTLWWLRDRLAAAWMLLQRLTRVGSAGPSTSSGREVSNVESAMPSASCCYERIRV